MVIPELFSSKLIAWYLRHQRDLPWRQTRDPYKIWLSEVILQQTRVKQGLPYYYAFVEKFPTVFDLARAEEQEVLRLWQGLGYYSRARNLQFTARQIVAQYNGQFPDSYKDLLKLKGIGPYTAAAVASFAYKERVAVLDGNVFRVLSRLYGIDTDIASAAAKPLFSGIANRLIPTKDPDLFNQAIMEFGALQCTPANPDCMFCPFHNECEAFLTGRQAQLPVKSKKGNSRIRYFHYVIFRKDDRGGMRKRDQKDIWNGLHDFYLLEDAALLTTGELMAAEPLLPWTEAVAVEEESVVYTHKLTHQQVQAKFWHIRLNEAADVDKVARDFGLTFVESAQAHHLPKPVLIDNYLKKRVFSLSL